MIDLHRHGEYSDFDGYGKASDLAKIAKEKGYKSLGLTDHGTTGGLIGHYFACKKEGIKPIMGCEVYFMPTFKKERKSFHLCLFVKNLAGYKNLNKILTIASEENFYYKPIVTFELLEKYSEGLICTSACLGGFIPRLVMENKSKALKATKRFKKIFGDDFYIEIQPYKLSEKGLQERLNIKLIKLANEVEVKPILTSDSHFSDKKYWETYLKMREIAKHNLKEVKEMYSERHMPDKDELKKRFYKMHKKDFDDCKSLAKEYNKNISEIGDKVEEEILEKIPFEIPTFDRNAKTLLKKEIIKGLKEKGKYNKESIKRSIKEYDIIIEHGFEDYFLIVQDYVKWAKDSGISVGPGRGSVCNCFVAYALGITSVDSIKFDLNFQRFLRMDKNKLPDIDLDFETERRQEVIDYIIKRYPKRAAQVCSYGLYKVDNLLNDLVKVCGVTDVDEKKEIKRFVKSYESEGVFDYDKCKRTAQFKKFNSLYDNILEHFNNLFKQVRFIGTHAAGVVVTKQDISLYTAILKRSNMLTSAYDLHDMEKINAIKFDMLGLKTMSIIGDLEKSTGEKLEEWWFEDEKIIDHFKEAKTTGIFQYESNTARSVLSGIDVDCFADVYAASALNRPGPLSLKMPEQYAENKMHQENIKDSKFYKYTKETYGTIVYQEQIMDICVRLAKTSWEDADRIIKHAKSIHTTEEILRKHNENDAELRGKFVSGCVANGMRKNEANELFDNITVYSFNKGHAVGYGIISLQEMHYKIYHPVHFWITKMNYCKDEANLSKFKAECVFDGNLILLPHVNYHKDSAIVKVEGEETIAEGYKNIKNVGEKAALTIQNERDKNGPFKSYDDFVSRVPRRSVNSRVISALLDHGALEFSKNIYFKRVKKYNSTLYMKGLK